MLKRITVVCVAMCLLLTGLSVLASVHSILWASTSDHTELVKDERYAAEMVLMMPVPGVDDAVSLLVEGSDDGLVFLYEEPDPPGLDGAEAKPASPELGGEEEKLTLPELVSVEEVIPPELASVEDKKTEVIDFTDEDEAEEPIHDEIQIP